MTKLPRDPLDTEQIAQSLQGILATVPAGLFLVDHGGVCQYANTIFQQLIAAPSPHPVRIRLFDVIHEEDRQQVRTALQQALVAGTVAYTEFRLLDHRRQAIWVFGGLRAWRDRAGAHLGYLGTVVDITSKRHVESELVRLNAELAHVTRLKDEFLANMSHELRTPLTAILSLSDALLLGMGGVLNQEQHEMVASLLESGQHLLTILNDVLDLAKIEAGQLQCAFSPVEIRPCCESVFRVVGELAKKKHLVLQLQLDDPLTMLRTDGRLLKQILVNLLTNAIKFTPPGGRLGLQVAEDITRRQLAFTVWDTGIGIPDDQLPTLFDPYTQIPSTTTRPERGVGLGLSLVKRMTLALHGTVSVESELGKGSRFTVSLPWQEADDSRV